MKRNERILVIFNPSSGVVSKDTAASVIFKKLQKHFETVSLINSNSPEHGMGIARKAVENFDVITAFGGDGTINSIASVLLGTGKTMGVLPGGSGNGLVRNLGIPISWRRALDVLIHGTDVLVDAGKINDRYFFNVAGIGLDALVAKRFNLESKSRGVPTYIYQGLKSLLESPTYRVEIRTGDMEFRDEIMVIAFANFKQYGANLVVAPFASPCDRQLDMCIINKFKLLKESHRILNLFDGNIHKLPFYRTFQFDRCEIRSLEGEIPFHFDGEYGGRDSARYVVEVLPGKIKMRVPADGIEAAEPPPTK